MLGSRAPSLLSVAIGHLYQSDFNSDKKLLAFTDSVQDASHRAGFFGARTYRFNLRTAFQGVIEAAGDEGVALSQLGERTWDYWLDRHERVELIPTLMPADLFELDTYRGFVEQGGTGRHRKLQEQLHDRLSWEAVMEFGLNSRVGRSLENTLCSAVATDADALSEAAEALALELAEVAPFASPPAEPLSAESLRHFLAGLLYRLRTRGGVDHPLLASYVREQGNRYLLSKRKQPLMSPFGPDTVLPRFLTDRSARDRAVFDSISSRADQYTWLRDWAERALGIPRNDDGINELYREAMKRLKQAGLLRERELSGGGHAWGFDASRLRVVAGGAWIRCPECRRTMTVPKAEVSQWEARACTHFRCTGRLETQNDSEANYYGRIYRSGRLKRIFAYEHTGLLERKERERVEEEFKAGELPGAPNLLVCTPTLEMGIDIGDLSAAFLCSVPPTTANFLQRVGRAGRKTGNAFGLTLANARPHDTYFHAQPEEMMAGQVLPPGCFLDAPEMLRRQLVAYAMDCWAREEGGSKSIPRNTRSVLSASETGGFPADFVSYYRQGREDLTQSFLETFEGELSEFNRERLQEFGIGDQVALSVEGAFERIRTELKELTNQQQRAKRRIQEIENDPDSSDDPEQEKADLEETRKLLSRIAIELNQKYPLNVLTDEGVLPNYAFPEPGVKLESVVSQRTEKGQWEYEPRDYMRPASSAIRELAPFNTFYADGRKVKIDEIDIGSASRPLSEMWRLCRECSYMRREADDAPIAEECPRCKDRGWPDSGQARTLIHFRRSRSLATRLEASTVDDSDDRDEAFYELLDLIDVGPEHYNGTKLIESVPFGYELLKNLTLREVNFGLDDRPAAQGLRVCGHPIGERGFEVCIDCGRARDPQGGEIRHAAPCRAKKAGMQEQTSSVFLYREIQSEAIRILLPVSEVGLDAARASFKAALELGFRRHFQGSPGHLIVRSVREPMPGGVGGRQFLVVFDGVPGGTGYLAELWQEGHFLGVLEKALLALQTCECQQASEADKPDRDGCYRCLYAYQNQRELSLVSSRRAQELLRSILEKRDELTRVDTLSDVSLDSKLESELEVKFLDALREHSKQAGWVWNEDIERGERRWMIETTNQRWEMRAQIDVPGGRGVLACKPDFVIRAANADPEVKPIAIFCDGLAYHACPGKPEGRTGDDILKRRGLLEFGGYRVWSITWKDVVDLEERPGKSTAPLLFGELALGRLGRAAERKGLQLGRGIGQLGSMDMLVEYLRRPEEAQWQALAEVYLLSWLSGTEQWLSPTAGANVEERLLGEAQFFLLGPIPQVDRSAPTFTHADHGEWRSLLARSSRASFGTGRVDRSVLRLFDEPEARDHPEFEGSWRAFLQAWNLLQFQNGLEVTSSEIASGIYGDQSAADVAVAAEAVDTDFADELSALLEIATEAARPIMEAVAARGLPLPDLDFELPSAAGGVGPQSDLAWPDQQLAVLAPNQVEDAPAFEEAGWTVLIQPADPDSVLERLTSGADRTGSEGAER